MSILTVTEKEVADKITKAKKGDTIIIVDKKGKPILTITK